MILDFGQHWLIERRDASRKKQGEYRPTPTPDTLGHWKSASNTLLKSSRQELLVTPERPWPAQHVQTSEGPAELPGERLSTVLLHPNNHKSLLPRGHRPSLALCTSDRWPYVCELGHLPAADPPVAPASFNVLELSGETTVKSKAAGLPLNQLGTKMSAGRLSLVLGKHGCRIRKTVAETIVMCHYVLSMMSLHVQSGRAKKTNTVSGKVANLATI
eukprot:Em0004g975a